MVRGACLALGGPNEARRDPRQSHSVRAPQRGCRSPPPQKERLHDDPQNRSLGGELDPKALHAPLSSKSVCWHASRPSLPVTCVGRRDVPTVTWEQLRNAGRRGLWHNRLLQMPASCPSSCSTPSAGPAHPMRCGSCRGGLCPPCLRHMRGS